MPKIATPSSQARVNIKSTYSGAAPRPTVGQAGGVNARPPTVKNVSTNQGVSPKLKSNAVHVGET